MQLNRIRLNYLGALILIGLLAAYNLYGLYQVAVTQARANELINISGRQRMLSQRIAFLSSRLLVVQDADERSAIRSLLLDVSRQMEGAFSQLVGLQDTSVLQAIYQAQPHRVNERVPDYLASVRALAALPDTSLTLLAAPYQEVIAQVEGLLVGLEAATLERQRSNSIVQVTQTAALSFALMLTALAVLGIFVFRPLERQILREHSELTTEVAERKRAEESLREQQDQLVRAAQQEKAREMLQVQLGREQELNRQKTDMMIRIAHEFRTPLTVISTSTEMIDRYWERMSSEKRQTHTDHILGEVQHLTKMIDSIGRVVLPRERALSRQFLERTEVWKIVDTAVAAQQRQFPQRGIDSFCDVEDVNMQTDGELLQEIIEQLLSNALKFSQGKVMVVVWAERQHLMISIIDQGMGIPSDDLPLIRSPFYRGRNIGEVPGMGLGLTIAEQAVEMMEGYIAIESVPGLTIATVMLPLDSSAAA
jgi:signal transduction histidine kinase